MKYRIAIDGLLSDFAGGEAVLLDLTRKRYHNLNATGAFIWTTLEKGPATESELSHSLSLAYAVDDEKARAAIARFNADLLTRGLIEAIEG